ncbi:hypothetical protein SBRCBS47491_004197 [Sporothrix bragantina]|uniref:rRNA methyltransferase 1, mitochondrial n=1 Tax=Sporothrix bragantina TaxID=671064 RepID=A0ABP0BLK6_9PEZI
MPPLTPPAVTARLSPRLITPQHAQHILLARSQQSFRPQHAALAPLVPGRASSMSAIVRGLRRTFRDPDGKRPPGYNSEVAAHVRKRRQEREAAEKPNYRLFRGKKDVTEPAVPKAKTRRARFFDPEDEYGKKSLVYQAKTGALEAEVKALSKQLRRDLDDGEQGTGREFSRSIQKEGGSGRSGRIGRMAQRSDASSYGRRGVGSSRQGASGRRVRDNDRGGYERRHRETASRPSDSEDAFAKRFDNRHDAGPSRERRDFKEDRGQDYTRAGQDRGQNHGQNRGEGRGRDGRNSGRDSRRNEAASSPPVPVAIPFTTAASHFLYGRSVVEAALRSARRQLYKLYIYNGANRSSAPQDQQTSRVIERMATRRGVNVQLVDERWQRLLDKMSKGRPHNGYVLEASPLPQPPLTALGPVSLNGVATSPTDSPFAKGPGFRIELGHQSREEANVNGTSTFVSVDPTTATHHRPFVLLLDQVLDPGNLGAILRSASFLGVSAVAVSKHSSATLTSVALKASAGAAEAMALFSVETPETFLAESRRAGWKVYTAVPPPEDAGSGTSGVQRSGKKPVLDLDGIEHTDPLKKDAIILVMGSEGEGLPRAIRRQADVEVTIANRSGSNVVDSLNVSVATGLLCASFLKGATKGAAGPTEKDEHVAETTTEATEANKGEISEEKKVDDKAEETKASDELNIF